MIYQINFLLVGCVLSLVFFRTAQAQIPLHEIPTKAAISSGLHHTIALRADSTVWTAGRNNYGQLGLGNTVNRNVFTEITFFRGKNIIAIAASGHHSMALAGNGYLYVWGYNNKGQLGLGDTDVRLSPTLISSATVHIAPQAQPEVLSIPRFNRIAAGLSFSLALSREWLSSRDASGRRIVDYYPDLFGSPAYGAGPWPEEQFILAFGDNSRGQLGTNDYIDQISPRNSVFRTSADAAIARLAAGSNHSVITCTSYLKSQGVNYRYLSTYLTGDNSNGQILPGSYARQNTFTSTTTYTPDFQVTKSAEIIAGDEFWLKLSVPLAGVPNNQILYPIFGSGKNNYGQLGLGVTGTSDSGFIWQLADGTLGFYGVRTFASGKAHCLASRADGRVLAWGENTKGKLGLGSITANQKKPTFIPVLLDIAFVSAGGDQSFAVAKNGAIHAFGGNEYGQLGRGNTTNTTQPVLLNSFRLWNDNDGDKIPDEWEMACFGGLTADPLADPDNDQLTTLEEYDLGTHPMRADTDGDGLPDGYENGRWHLNPQFPNAVAADIDSDGIGELVEFQQNTDSLAPDSDGDGLSDGLEVRHFGTNPTNLDTDGDGLSDFAEILINSHWPLSFSFKTNPKKWDTDGDLLPDGWEVLHGLNANSAQGSQGRDGDPDGDGLTNLEEFIHGTKPMVPDSDSDGASDSAEVFQGSDPNNSGDAGQAPPEGSTVNVIFRVGDPSGSHSERWEMEITPSGDDARKPFKFVSSDFGQVDEEIFKLWRGSTYTIKLNHISSNQTGSPDYDWEALVGGKPSSSVKSAPQGNAGQPGQCFLVGNAWLVDNTSGLLGLCDQSFDKTNHAAGKTATLLPIEITKLWSNQLSGVTDANYLPNKTGQADRAYLLMGACQSNNFDLKGHLKAKVNVGGSPELRDKILWRLAGKNGSTYVPENGSSTYNANGDEVTIVLDNPRTDDENSYYLVAGYDQDGNGQLSSAEASVVPKYKWKRKVNGQLRTDDHDYEVKIISRTRYDQARQTLNSLAGTWNTVGLSQASRLMSAYLNEQTPTGATAVPVMIGRDEPGLTHSVGVLFAAPGNPGPSITATFGPASQMTADVLDSTTFNNWLSDQFEQKRQDVASRFQNSEEIIETFVWNFKGDLSFSVASVPDLFFALGRTKVDVTVEVEVHRFLYTVESTSVTGSVTDLYDFDYDDRSGYAGYGDFVRDAARVQAGYNTIGTGGRVYKSDVQMSNSPHSIQFQFQ